MFTKLKLKCQDFLGITQIAKELEQVKKNNSNILSNILRKQILQFPLGVNLDCRLNQVSALIPVEVLKNYIHCLHCYDETKIDVLVENHCSDWLSKHLKNGDIVLDIGAAFGVISLPLSKSVGEQGCVYAFEPALKTQAILKRLIEANQLNNVQLIPKAISDNVGLAEFIECTSDNNFAWAPDTSTLAKGVQPAMEHYLKYTVEVTTIDEFVRSEEIRPKAIKIDIEGFELYALQGTKQTLSAHRPHLCIDIHLDVKTQKSSLLPIESFLNDLGYQFNCQEHTLFASFYE